MKELRYTHKGSPIQLAKSLESSGLNINYNQVMKLLRKKDIKINGKKTNQNQIVSDGDEIKLYVPDASIERSVAKDRIVFIDDNIIVYNKPASQDVIELEELFSKEYGQVFLTHRLDRNTSGIICLARNLLSKAALENAFKLKKVEKHYLAEIVGRPKDYGGTLKAYLKKDADKSLVEISDTKKTGFVEIQTSYSVVEYREKSTLIDVMPKTGRTHQIRAHFAYIGHPIVGDGKYGKNTVNKQFKKKFQELTAYKLVFTFPPSSILSYLTKHEFSLPVF